MTPTPASSRLIPHAPERRAIAGEGTDEDAWHQPRLFERFDSIDVSAWGARYDRIWLVAPHPDDEVLALGGSLAGLSKADADVRIVSVTDGEASHRESPNWSRERLTKTRPIELQRALEALDVVAGVIRLGLPDGQIGAHRQTLLTALAERVEEHDLILATCRFDGHPDHEACGEVAQLVGDLTGADVFEYPVWMWHWATPDETSIPWNRARRLPVPPGVVERKRAAIDAFASQLMPDGPREPVLHPRILPRFLRPFELVFV